MVQNYVQLYKDKDLDKRIADIDNQLQEIQTNQNDMEIHNLDQQKTQTQAETSGYEGDDYDFYADPPAHHASDSDFMDMVEQRQKALQENDLKRKELANEKSMIQLEKQRRANQRHEEQKIKERDTAEHAPKQPQA